MIEQEITLLTNGRISFQKCGNGLQFGYSKNRGVYSIKVKTSGEWNGLTIRAFWHIPDIKEPITSLLVDNVIRVPALVTSYKGEGRIVFEGSDGAKTVTSADVRYYVNKNSGTCDGTIPEPGTPAWQELVGTVKKYSDTAVEAKESAKKSADEAKQALEDTKDVKSQAIEEINSSKTAVIEEIENKKNLSIEEINSVKEDAKGELEALCDSTRDFANQAKEAADKAKASEDASKKNADDSAATLQELKDGIASGDFKGDKGDPGPAGKDAPQIDDTTVNDSAPWSSKHIVDVLCPPLEETGNPVVFYPVADYPLGVTASWEPVQEGSGDPSPDNIRPIKGRETVSVERCGENLLTVRELDIPHVTNIKISIPSGKYILSGYATTNANSDSVLCDFLDASGKLIVPCYLSTNVNANTGFTLTRRAKTLSAYAAKNNALSIGKIARIDNVQITPGTTPPSTYSPYTGQTATLTLPRTIYGGTVDAVTGVGKEVWRLITLDGVSEKFVNEYDDYWNLLPMNTPGISNQNIDYIVSSHFYHAFGGNITGFLFTTSSMMKRYFATPDELNAYIAAQYAAGTPVQIAYKLVTPEPFTATGALPIPALPGVNTIMTDADSVTVTGRADPIKRITDLEDAVASMTNT